MASGGSGSRGWAIGGDGSKSHAGCRSVSSSSGRWAAGHGGSVSSGGGQEAAGDGGYVSSGVDGWAASGGRSFVSSVGDGRPAGNDMAAIAAVRHDEFDFVTGLVDFDAETEDQQLGAVDVQVADFTVEGTVQLPEKMPTWSIRSLSALGRWLHVEKETEHARVLLVYKEDDLDTDEEEEGVFIDDVTEMYPPQQVVHIQDSKNYNR